jgi:hypothetical protein
VVKEHWKNEPEEHDYPAAYDYLTLITDDATATRLVDALKAAPLTHRKAKDILRASRLSPLGKDNVHVTKDLDKVAHGERLSPVLLVRGQIQPDLRVYDDLVIADGYHRVCASYYLDENADIPCKLL